MLLFIVGLVLSIASQTSSAGVLTPQAASAGSTSAVPIRMPVAPTIPIFTELFPACPADRALYSLRRCRSDLEIFLTAELEPFNQSIKDYSGRLVTFDARLRAMASKKEITQPEYEAWKAEISDALVDAGPSGSLMRIYKANVSRYKERARYVINEIHLCAIKGRSCDKGGS